MKCFSIFSNNQGSGYICNYPEEIYEELSLQSITLHGTILNADDFTSLDGHFCRPLQYIGLYGNEMVFYIGKAKDLFESKYFYQSVFRIAENRIFEIYAPGSGRDYIYVNGKWK